MFGKIANMGKLAGTVWSILNLMIPFLKGVVEIVKMLDYEEPDDEEKRGSKKKEIALDILMRIFDMIDEATSEDLPIDRERFREHLDGLIDTIVDVLNFFGILK